MLATATQCCTYGPPEARICPSWAFSASAYARSIKSRPSVTPEPFPLLPLRLCRSASYDLSSNSKVGTACLLIVKYCSTNWLMTDGRQLAYHGFAKLLILLLW